MKYERLTDSETAIMLKNTKGLSWEEDDIETQRYIRLAELEDKIENGTLVELPCKVGDTVYIVYLTTMREWEVESVEIFYDDILFRLGHKCTTDYNSFWLGEFGDTVFLTKAEAEKRLEELRGER